LQNYSFPGNIRELRHLFQSAWEQARSNILPEHFAIDCSAEAEVSADDQTFQVGPLRPAVKEFEKSFLEQTLREVRFDKSHASRLLQISRQTLYTKLKQHGLLETGG
jgi:two-component system response regulator AtoC